MCHRGGPVVAAALHCRVPGARGTGVERSGRGMARGITDCRIRQSSSKRPMIVR